MWAGELSNFLLRANFGAIVVHKYYKTKSRFTNALIYNTKPISSGIFTSCAMLYKALHTAWLENIPAVSSKKSLEHHGKFESYSMAIRAITIIITEPKKKTLTQNYGNQPRKTTTLSRGFFSGSKKYSTVWWWASIVSKLRCYNESSPNTENGIKGISSGNI